MSRLKCLDDPFLLEFFTQVKYFIFNPKVPILKLDKLNEDIRLKLGEGWVYESYN
jgi:hypothetical protein